MKFVHVNLDSVALDRRDFDNERSLDLRAKLKRLTAGTLIRGLRAVVVVLLRVGHRDCTNVTVRVVKPRSETASPERSEHVSKS